MKKILLTLIILLAFLLRFYQLGKNPPSLTWDEVAWGYNAYALGTDGKDEFGRFLPIDYFESFGDFKPPLYAYLDILPIKIFGLNEFAVRFPSAFFGVLTVLVTYYLAKRIFANSELKLEISLVAAAILAISPWHIMLSRAAFEANVATFLLVTGVWLFLGGVYEKRWCLPLSAIFLALSFYTFNTTRIVTPILLLTLIFGFKQRLFERKKEAIIAVMIGIVLILPIVKFLMSPQASLRFKEVNIFSDNTIIEMINREVDNDKNSWWSKVIHNRRFVYTVEYLRHYFDNFSPNFLFIKGDGNPKFSTQDVGQLYLWEIPFLIIGGLFLFKKKEGNWWIIPLWLIIGIIPAATARETPHALRIETTLPTFQLFVAYGLVNSINKITKYKNLILAIILSLVFLNFVYFAHGYLAHYPSKFSHEWQYGYKESINYVKSVQNDYDQIAITTGFGRPYIYYLFYLKTDPDTFRQQAQIKRDVFGFVTVNSFGQYYFVNDLGAVKSNNKKILYINTPAQAPSNAKTLKTFYFLDGRPALVAYTF